VAYHRAAGVELPKPEREHNHVRAPHVDRCPNQLVRSDVATDHDQVDEQDDRCRVRGGDDRDQGDGCRPSRDRMDDVPARSSERQRGQQRERERRDEPARGSDETR